MIDLFYINNNIFIFNVEDWFILRKQHHIIGIYADNTNVIPTLPVKILSEEALFLIKNNIARVIERNLALSKETTEIYNKFEEEVHSSEQKSYKEIRKKQLEAMIDDIIKSKRKFGDCRPALEIFEEELEKSCQVTKENLVWPTLITPLAPQEIPSDEILRSTTVLKYSVYEELRAKNYYVTGGEKFGGDFLVYKGDPVAYHAIFIVKCLEDPDKLLHPMEIVAFGRLGTAVRKRAVLASYNEDKKVSFLTINWLDA